MLVVDFVQWTGSLGVAHMSTGNTVQQKLVDYPVINNALDVCTGDLSVKG